MDQNAGDNPTAKGKRSSWWLGAATGAIVILVVASSLYSALSWKLVPTSKSPIAYSEYSDPERSTSEIAPEKPRNMIIFIADGFGFAHMSLSMLTQGSAGVTPVWNQFPVVGWHDPRPHFGPITDSAASATALATGFATSNNLIGVDENGKVLTNLFEDAWQAGYRTGVVTDSYIWDATPAAFVTHSSSRDNALDILTQLANSNLEILFGELEDVGEEDVPDWDSTVKLLSSRFRLLGADLNVPQDLAAGSPIAAVFPEDSIIDASSTPNLKSMTQVALKRLASTDQPFLLLVECEEMDSASHRRDSNRILSGLGSIQTTIGLLLEFVAQRQDTLLVVTSDHETGGLAISYDQESYPNLKLVWSGVDHTATVVPLFARGPGADGFAGPKRNWEVGTRLRSLIQGISAQ